MHTPILVASILEFFASCQLRRVIDGTVGAGGHARALLQAHPEIEHFLGIDQDPTALSLAQERLILWKEKVEFARANFRTLADFGRHSADGILLDLGVSSMQLDRPERGFSFQGDGPLDMRMDPEGELTAEEIVNCFSQYELEKIFRELGEIPRWRQAAKAIVWARQKKRLRTTGDLCAAVVPAMGRASRRIHPATLVFQALRIRVNDELAAAEEGICAALSLLSPGGRLGVLSFHSLEDRIVKHTFRKWSQEGTFRLLTKKPLEASMEEVRSNPRSRSARLRFIEKVS